MFYLIRFTKNGIELIYRRFTKIKAFLCFSELMALCVIQAAVSWMSLEAFLNVKVISRAAIRSADACECNHRQRRLLSSEGVTERLATAILVPHTGEAPNRHQKLDYRARQSDDKDRQLQDQDCKLHRQITSFRKRRCRRVAGLIPLTSPCFRVKRSKTQTNILYFTSAVEAALPCAPGVSCISTGVPSRARMRLTNPTIEYRKAA